MPRDGCLTLDDLRARQIERLRITCPKCLRAGSYSLAGAEARWGHDAKLTDILADLTADCPRAIAKAFGDQCGAVYEGLG